MSTITAQQSAKSASPRNFLPGLVAVALFVEIVIIGFAVLSLYRSRIEYDERAKIATQNLAQLLEHDLTASFDKIDLAVLSVKDEAERQLAVGKIDKRTMADYIERQFSRQSNLDVLRVSDERGLLVNDTGADGTPRSIADRNYFIRLRDRPAAGLIITQPLIERISGKWSIAFARRIERPDGRFAGVALGAVHLERFQKLFALLKLGPHGAISLRGADLATVVRHPEPQTMTTETGNPKDFAEWPEKLKQNPVSGTHFAMDLDNRARILSYHRVGNYPFYIIAGLFPDDYLQEWRQEATRTLIVMTIFVFVTTLFLWMVARAWLRDASNARRVEQLSRRLIAVQEEERRKLALELHDVVSPNLAALKINLSMMESGAPSLRSDMKGLLDETTVRLRQICANLRPALLDYSGLVPALQGYAEQFAGAVAISVRVSGEKAGQRLPAERESLLFRIAQEAVTNSVKHAQAKNITIELTLDADKTRMSISDDGLGFDVVNLSRSHADPGLGLLTMRERAEFAGGTFHIESHRRSGTRVTVEL